MRQSTKTTFITERARKSLILRSNRAPADWYPLFPNPVVAESLLDRLINNSHQVFMNPATARTNGPGVSSPPGALFKTPCDREEEKPAGGIECVIIGRVRTAIVGVEYLPVLEVGDESLDRCPK